MLSKQRIKEIFGSDENHFSLANYVLDADGEILYAEEDGLLLFFKGIHVIFGTSGQGLENVLALIKTPNCLVCSSCEEGDAVIQRFKNIKYAESE